MEKITRVVFKPLTYSISCNAVNIVREGSTVRIEGKKKVLFMTNILDFSVYSFLNSDIHIKKCLLSKLYHVTLNGFVPLFSQKKKYTSLEPFI